MNVLRELNLAKARKRTRETIGKSDRPDFAINNLQVLEIAIALKEWDQYVKYDPLDESEFVEAQFLDRFVSSNSMEELLNIALRCPDISTHAQLLQVPAVPY